MSRRRVATNLLATAALVLGVAGGSYGALKLPRNSVRSASIVDGQVKTRDIARNAVTASKVKQRAVGRRKFRGALPIGLAGARGLDGDPGADGALGPRGPATVRYHLAVDHVVVPPSTSVTVPMEITPSPGWTQAAGETDIASMHARVAVSSGDFCSSYATITVASGTSVMTSVLFTGTGDFTGSGLKGLTAPGIPAPRTLTVTAKNLCGGYTFSVELLDVDVLRVGA
jgi:hypothetical protein